jgi:iron complex outermembrane receptor protein
MISARKATMLAGTMFLAISGAAAQAKAAEQPSVVGEVVVTGTRLKLPEYTAPNPVMSITSVTLQNRGVVNLTDYLKTVPALTNSLKSEDYANAGNRGSVGLNELNLRNLGTQRTLVLVNGLRHVAGDPGTQAVDINSIPISLIDRVEVLTGGVSAIYGADAVSGVVNFILKDNFEGADLRAQGGFATEGAGESERISALLGHNFADGRVNLTFDVEAENNMGLNTSDRTYLQPQNAMVRVRNPGPNGPTYIFSKDVRYKDSAEGGAVYTNFGAATSYSGVSYQGDGQRWVDGVDGGHDYMIGGSGTLTGRYREQVLPPSKRLVLNSTFHVDITPKLRFFGEAKWAHTETTLISQPSFNYGIFVPIDNPYIPSSILADATTLGGLGTPDGAAALGLPGPGVLVGRDNFDLGHVIEDINRDTYRFVGGFKGSPTDYLNFQLAYVYGRTDTRDVEKNNRIEERFYAAADVITNPSTGQAACRSSVYPDQAPFGDTFLGEAPIPNFGATFTPGPNSGCIPINIFGPNISKAAANWINTTTVQTSRIEQHDLSGYISGRSTPLFELPGGPVAYAIGGEYRHESSVSRASDIQKLAAADRFNISFLGQGVDSLGAYDIYEGYGEVNAPLVKDLPLAKFLSVGAAYRFSHYSTAGDTNTYKFNFEWKPVQALMFRGTYAQAVRAPNIGELYLPTVQTYATIDDPCDINNVAIGKAPRVGNCDAALTALGLDPSSFSNTTSSSVAGTIGGNAKLKPETAITYTYGLVFAPSFIANLYFSLDYYNINLTQAIETFTGQDIANKCYDLPQPNPFCATIHRDSSTGFINAFQQKFINIAGYKTSGFDFTIRYRLNPANFGVTADIGKLDIALEGNKLEDLTFNEDPSAAPDKQIGTVDAPVWQLDLNTTWTYHRLTVNYGFNWSSKTRRYTKETQRADPNYVLPQYFYFSPHAAHDLQVRYDFSSKFEAFVGCNNCSDQRPDISDPQPSEPVSPLGRYVYAGVEARF